MLAFPRGATNNCEVRHKRKFCLNIGEYFCVADQVFEQDGNGREKEITTGMDKEAYFKKNGPLTMYINKELKTF